MGNGFSKILQMINVDLKNPFSINNNLQSSINQEYIAANMDNEDNKKNINDNNRKVLPNGVTLPKIDNKDKTNDVDSLIYDNSRQKIVNVYKKKPL